MSNVQITLADGQTKFNTITVPMEITVSEQDLCDIVTTALEGGINYWCRKAHAGDAEYPSFISEIWLTSPEASIFLVDAEEPEEYVLTRQKLIDALARYIPNSGGGILYDGGLDMSCIDATIADELVQMAAIGGDEATYG